MYINPSETFATHIQRLNKKDYVNEVGEYKNYNFSFFLPFCYFFPKKFVHSEKDQRKPVVMVLLNEKIWVGNRRVYDHYWNTNNTLDLWTSVSQTETTFINMLLDRGLIVIGNGPSNLTKQKARKSDTFDATQGDDQFFTNLGNSLKPDFVITGEAVARSSRNSYYSGQKEARASINVRVIKVATGEIVAVESGNALSAAIEQIGAGAEALQKADKPIAEKLADKILKAGLK